MNVILVTVDCLRYDKVGCISGRRDLTPNLDRFSQQATVFTQAISQGYNTENSFPSIFTSTYPRAHRGQWRKKQIRTDKPTLAALLRPEGYATGGFHSNPWLSTYFGYGREYDIYEDNLLPSAIRSRSKQAIRLSRALHTLSPYHPADKITAQALGWISQQRGPFFVWIHYMDAHGPFRLNWRLPAWLGHSLSWRLYQKAQTQPDRITSAEHRKLVQRYEGGVQQVDMAWSDLQQGLETLGRLDDTMMIVTADHGEAFGEHGLYTHGHLHMYDEVLRVPLILRWPGRTATPRVDGQVELTTIVPTVLQALGMPIPDHVVGRSAVPWLQGEASPDEAVNAEAFSGGGIDEDYAAVCVRTPEWKYILRRSRAEEAYEAELYNLTTDPGEKAECAQYYPEVAARLHERVEAHIDDVLADAELVVEGEEVPEEVVARLRALGYLD